MATEEIDSKQLQIEVCHSSAQKLQKDLEIGEVFGDADRLKKTNSFFLP